MSTALVTVLAVGTGVVVIIVAIAVVLVVLLVTLSILHRGSDGRCPADECRGRGGVVRRTGTADKSRADEAPQGFRLVTCWSRTLADGPSRAVMSTVTRPAKGQVARTADHGRARVNTESVGVQVPPPTPRFPRCSRGI